MTKIIGLTGGIGSGKTTVLKMFQKKGAAIYIADIEAKKIMTFNKELKKEIMNLLGENSYKNNQLNRAFIAKQIFENPEKLQKLNALVHPKVRQDFLDFSKAATADILVYEAAILFESGADAHCDYVITVTADKEQRIQRVMLRDKADRDSVVNRIKNQTSDEEKIKKSDFVIYNNNLLGTQKQVEDILEKIQNQPNF